MFALIAALVLTSPVHVDPARAACRVWWSNTEKRCRDADVEVIGDWDPRPAPGEWPRESYYGTEPKDWGAYPLESR